MSTAVALRPPAHLSRRAKALWRGVVGDYEIEPHALTLLQAALETLDRLDAVRGLIDQQGLVVEGSKGQPVPNRLLATERDLRIALARLWRELDLEGEPPADVRVPRRR